jgi:hypothetical protein
MRAIVVILLLAACGPGEENGAKDSAPQTTAIGVAPQHPVSFVAYNLNGLPECKVESAGWLVYVKSENGFFTCEAGKWEPISIKGDTGAMGPAGATGEDGEDGEDGQNGKSGEVGPQGAPGLVAAQKRWKFHADTVTPMSESVLIGDGVSVDAVVTDIQVVEFEGGSALVFASGVVFDQVQNGSGDYMAGFSHSFWVTDAFGDFREYVAKLSGWADMRIKYKVQLFSSVAPLVRAVGDADGDFSNNFQQSYTMSTDE